MLSRVCWGQLYQPNGKRKGLASICRMAENVPFYFTNTFTEISLYNLGFNNDALAQVVPKTVCQNRLQKFYHKRCSLNVGGTGLQESISPCKWAGAHHLAQQIPFSFKQNYTQLTGKHN